MKKTDQRPVRHRATPDFRLEKTEAMGTHVGVAANNSRKVMPRIRYPDIDLGIQI